MKHPPTASVGLRSRAFFVGRFSLCFRPLHEFEPTTCNHSLPPWRRPGLVTRAGTADDSSWESHCQPSTRGRRNNDFDRSRRNHPKQHRVLFDLPASRPNQSSPGFPGWPINLSLRSRFDHEGEAHSERFASLRARCFSRHLSRSLLLTRSAFGIVVDFGKR